MSDAREVVVLSGVRTAIGAYGGGLKDQAPSDLAAMCVREAIQRAGIEPSDVGHVVFGNIIHTDAHDHYLARVAVREWAPGDHHGVAVDYARRYRCGGGRWR
jgi:acetyl-CoA C-acetyltransferase